MLSQQLSASEISKDGLQQELLNVQKELKSSQENHSTAKKRIEILEMTLNVSKIIFKLILVRSNNKNDNY